VVAVRVPAAIATGTGPGLKLHATDDTLIAEGIAERSIPHVADLPTEEVEEELLLRRQLGLREGINQAREDVPAADLRPQSGKATVVEVTK
jgi:hypothetical protein